MNTRLLYKLKKPARLKTKDRLKVEVMNYIKKGYSLALLLILASCSKREQLVQRKIVVTPYRPVTIVEIPHLENPAITIWVHGTRCLPFSLFNSYFHSEPGLYLAQKINPKFHLRTITQTIIDNDPIEFPPQTFYVFGWSGKLCFGEREKAAQQLFEELHALIKRYEKRYNTKPFVRIIAHSHGGNVVLNLASIQNPNEPIQIHELVLLACPVQKKTKDFIKDDMFQQVYVYYSSFDLTQVIDPQGLYNTGVAGAFFSKRRFPRDKKITQLKIKINGHAIMHAQFISAKFLYHLPTILKEIKLWQKQEPALMNNLVNHTRLVSLYIQGKWRKWRKFQTEETQFGHLVV